MFPLFHFACPLLLTHILEHYSTRKKMNITEDNLNNIFYFNKFCLLLGAILPDLIDKPLKFLFNDNGRGLAHSLIFFLILTICVHFLSKNWHISLSLGFGVLCHLILDMPAVPWFFPFVLYDFGWESVTIWDWVSKLFHDPVVIITEITGFIILLSVAVKNNLFNRINLIKYLQKNHI